MLVTGAPGSGKTTWCAKRATTEDTIIDLDDCFREVCGTHGHDADKQYLDAAIRFRNAMLADLSRRHTGTAFVIVSTPSQADMNWWRAKLGAEHIMIDPGIEECERRIRPDRKHLVSRWYAVRRGEG